MSFFKKTLVAAWVMVPGIAVAGEISLMYLPQSQIEYEGTGYRRFDEGWELKVKPQSAAAGFLWRHPLSDRWDLQAQFWRNQSFFAREDGNAKSDLMRQTGQTELTVNNLILDVRRPLAGSSVRAVAGLQGVYENFHRKEILFNAVPEAGDSRENLSAAGAVLGFAGASPDSTDRNRFYCGWEALFGHFFYTRTSHAIDGGSIHRDGYSYALRLETGYQMRKWRLGAGFVRQLIQVQVPGGRTFPGGAAASLPINKTDFFGLFLALSHVY
ncbi:MAG TPA: hypothetical protein P5079_02020 [Elusimicrobiota bacterium]|nr:hypothetical protein [Elusimicrobiota bacterium]